MQSDAERLGEQLREAREARGLSLEKAEQQTRIRAKYLEAMEQGNYAALPSPVHTHGFLRNYARYLGMDADDVVERYDAMQGGRRRRTKRYEDPTLVSQRTIPKRETASLTPATASTDVTEDEPRRQRKRRDPLVLLAVGILGLALVGGIGVVAIVGLQSLIARNNSGIILSPLPSTPTVQATQVFTDTTTPQRPSPLPPPKSGSNTQPPQATSANVSPDNVALSLQIVQRTWLRVIVDEVVEYTGSVAPGTTLQYQGKKINVRIENGAGVRAILNGQDIGILGARGQIVDQTFTPGNIIQATIPPPSTVSPTQTAVSYTSPGATFSFTATGTTQPTSTVTHTYTFTIQPSATKPPSSTPSSTPTASNTPTPMPSATPSRTLTPSLTFTPSVTPTITPTILVLPHETSTPQGGEIRSKN